MKQFNLFATENNIKKEELEPLYANIKKVLRSIEFDPVFELESDQEISKFDSQKIAKDIFDSIIKELEQKKWDEMYEVLLSFMKENYHSCLTVKDVYKRKPLGKWVDKQRKFFRKTLDSSDDNFNKLSSMKVIDNIQIPKEVLINREFDTEDINHVVFEWSSSRHVEV